MHIYKTDVNKKKSKLINSFYINQRVAKYNNITDITVTENAQRYIQLLDSFFLKE